MPAAKGPDEAKTIHLREVTGENWRDTLRLAVHPEQQRFVAEYAPIAAVALAKAYIRPGGALWTPYAVYADSTMVGFLALAYEPGTSDEYWLFHFFIDQQHQGRGYGKAALAQLIAMARREHPQCDINSVWVLDVCESAWATSESVSSSGYGSVGAAARHSRQAARLPAPRWSQSAD